MLESAKDEIGYARLLLDALRGVVRAALQRAATAGLPGEHHFYLSFRTRAEGVVLPARLAAQFPEEMTLVLQHQFWDLVVDERAFSVTLRFGGQPERVTVPFATLTAFADPSVEFGLRLAPAEDPAGEGRRAGARPPVERARPRRPKSGADEGQGKVVKLAAFKQPRRTRGPRD